MKLLASALSVLLIWMTGCQTVRNGQYETRSYVWVGKHMNRTWPYVIDLRNGAKRLVFVGCDHVSDTTHQQFATIETYFADLKPQIAFNEGGQITEHYVSRNAAISRSGETGCLKFLSDNAGIQMLDGDFTDSLEYVSMLRKYPKDQLFLYYVMERIVIPHLAGADGNQPYEEAYNHVVSKWFVNRGFPLADTERSPAYFRRLYQSYMGRPFELKLNQAIEQFDYVNGGNCKFCAIGRASKMVRDSVLLAKIDRALDQYDRVMVTFGGGHALAIEPALKQLISRKKTP